jgi:hypothetical protein
LSDQRLKIGRGADINGLSGEAIRAWPQIERSEAKSYHYEGGRKKRLTCHAYNIFRVHSQNHLCPPKLCFLFFLSHLTRIENLQGSPRAAPDGIWAGLVPPAQPTSKSHLELAWINRNPLQLGKFVRSLQIWTGTTHAYPSQNVSVAASLNFQMGLFETQTEDGL